MGELSNQIYLYSLETKDFYTDKENELNELYFEQLILKKQYKDEILKLNRRIKKLDANGNQYIEELDSFINAINYLKGLYRSLDEIKSSSKGL